LQSDGDKKIKIRKLSGGSLRLSGCTLYLLLNSMPNQNHCENNQDFFIVELISSIVSVASGTITFVAPLVLSAPYQAFHKHKMSSDKSKTVV